MFTCWVHTFFANTWVAKITFTQFFFLTCLPCYLLFVSCWQRVEYGQMEHLLWDTSLKYLKISAFEQVLDRSCLKDWETSKGSSGIDHGLVFLDITKQLTNIFFYISLFKKIHYKIKLYACLKSWMMTDIFLALSISVVYLSSWSCLTKVWVCE